MRWWQLILAVFLIGCGGESGSPAERDKANPYYLDLNKSHTGTLSPLDGETTNYYYFDTDTTLNKARSFTIHVNTDAEYRWELYSNSSFSSQIRSCNYLDGDELPCRVNLDDDRLYYLAVHYLETEEEKDFDVRIEPGWSEGSVDEPIDPDDTRDYPGTYGFVQNGGTSIYQFTAPAMPFYILLTTGSDLEWRVWASKDDVEAWLYNTVHVSPLFTCNTLNSERTGEVTCEISSDDLPASAMVQGRRYFLTVDDVAKTGGTLYDYTLEVD